MRSSSGLHVPAGLDRVLRAAGLGTGGAVVLLGLLVVDALLIALHLSRGLVGEPEDQAFNLSAELGNGEFLQQAKAVWIVLMLLGLWLLSRQAVLVAWAGVFAWAALDDALMLHERGGSWIAEHTPAGAGTGEYANHLGEGLYFALAGIGVVTAVALAHRYSSAPARVLSWRLVVVAVVGAFFAVGVDALQTPFYVNEPGGLGDVLLTAVEDGGELAVLSVAVAVVFSALLPQITPIRSAPDTVRR